MLVRPNTGYVIFHTGMLVKEHALPRVAWLRLSHVRAAWQELGARLREHQVRRTLHPSWWW